MIERILVAYDESQQAERALKVAIDLCRALGADLKVVTVVEPTPSYLSFAPSAKFALHWRQEQHARCSVLQRHASRQLSSSGVYPDLELVPGDEVGTIVACAKKYRARSADPGNEKAHALVGAHRSASGGEGSLLGPGSPIAVLILYV
jgi:nucleotide-binding universal stress UspA family protein